MERAKTRVAGDSHCDLCGAFWQSDIFNRASVCLLKTQVLGIKQSGIRNKGHHIRGTSLKIHLIFSDFLAFVIQRC